MKIILFFDKDHLARQGCGTNFLSAFYQAVSCTFKDYGTWRPVESDMSLMSAKNKREWVNTSATLGGYVGFVRSFIFGEKSKTNGNLEDLRPSDLHASSNN